MPTPKIKDAELRAVLAALETDLNTAFEAAKPGLLAKADDGSEKKDAPPSESTDDSASPPADDGSAAPSSPPAPPTAPASAVPPAGSPAGSPPPGAPASPAPAGDPAAAGAEASLTPEALQAEYAQLSPEELDMHLQAAMAAKEALAASAAPAGMPGGAPPAPAASPAAGAPPPAMKSEAGATGTGGTPSTHAKANGGQEKEVKKSEPDYQALLTQVATLQKSLDDAKAATAAAEKSYAEDVQNLTKAVTLVLERPERKAITGVSQIEYIKKSEAPAEVKKTFTPAEAKAKLTELIPVLSKSERDLLVRVTTGMAKFEELQPVLDKHLTK